MANVEYVVAEVNRGIGLLQKEPNTSTLVREVDVRTGGADKLDLRDIRSALVDQGARISAAKEAALAAAALSGTVDRKSETAYLTFAGIESDNKDMVDATAAAQQITENGEKTHGRLGVAVDALGRMEAARTEYEAALDQYNGALGLAALEARNNEDAATRAIQSASEYIKGL